MSSGITRWRLLWRHATSVSKEMARRTFVIHLSLLHVASQTSRAQYMSKTNTGDEDRIKACDGVAGHAPLGANQLHQQQQHHNPCDAEDGDDTFPAVPIPLRLGSSSISSEHVSSLPTATGIAARLIFERLRDPHRFATLPGHKERCFDVSFSPLGTLFASASEDTTVRIWDASTYSPLLTLPHEAEVLRISWAESRVDKSDRLMLASATAAGKVRLWDISHTPQQHSNHNHHRHQRQQQHPQQRQDCGCNQRSGGGRDESPAAPLNTTANTTAQHHHDNEDDDDGGDEYEDDASHAPRLYASVASDLPHEDGEQVYACKFIGDDTLLTASGNHVYFWDLETGSKTATWRYKRLPGHSVGVFGGQARNPQGQVYVFDVETGILPGSGFGSRDVACVALSDGSVRVQDRRTSASVAVVHRAGAGHLTGLRLSEDGTVLVSCGGKGESTVWDTRKWSIRATLKGHTRPVYGSAFLKPGKCFVPTTPRSSLPPLLTWSCDGRLNLWEIGQASGVVCNAEQTLQYKDFAVFTAAFSPSGDLFVSGGGTVGECCEGHGPERTLLVHRL